MHYLQYICIMLCGGYHISKIRMIVLYRQNILDFLRQLYLHEGMLLVLKTYNFQVMCVAMSIIHQSTMSILAVSDIHVCLTEYCFLLQLFDGSQDPLPSETHKSGVSHTDSLASYATIHSKPVTKMTKTIVRFIYFSLLWWLNDRPHQ